MGGNTFLGGGSVSVGVKNKKRIKDVHRLHGTQSLGVVVGATFPSGNAVFTSRK